MFSGSPTTGLAPLTVVFNNQSTGDITSRIWDFGNGKTSTMLSPVFTYYRPGTYTVSLTVSGPGGSDNLTKTDYIKVDCPPPEADFTADVTEGEAFLKVTFSSQSEGNITEWLWDFGDGQTSTKINPAHVYSTPGTYDVSLRVKGDGGVDTKKKAGYIHVTPPPVPSVNFSADPLTGIVPLVVSFTDKSTGTITSRLWDFGNGKTGTSATPKAKYFKPGTYTVSLTVTGPGGSDKETKTDYITVNYPPPKADFKVDVTEGAVPLKVTFENLSGGNIAERL
jgi:PKD repeat protein